MSSSNRTRTLVATLVAASITLLFMLPMLWLVVSAFRPQADIFRYLSPLSFEAIVPTRVTLDNFAALFEKSFG